MVMKHHVSQKAGSFFDQLNSHQFHMKVSEPLP